jgi:hypothetical protein
MLASAVGNCTTASLLVIQGEETSKLNTCRYLKRCHNRMQLVCWQLHCAFLPRCRRCGVHVTNIDVTSLFVLSLLSPAAPSPLPSPQ